MLGKERNNEMSDSKFADQGWSAMSKMLDQEMPVATAPSTGGKRYGLLFLFLLIGFASGIGTMMVLQEDGPEMIEEAVPVPIKSNPREVAQTGDPVAAHLNPSSAENDKLAEISKQSNSIEQQIQTNFSKPSALLADQNIKTVDDKNLHFNSSSVIVFNKKSKVPTKASELLKNLPFEDSNRVNPFDQQQNDRSTSFTIDAVPSSKNEVAINHQNFEALALLSSKDIAFLDVKNELVELDLLPFPQEPKVNFGFYMGTQTRDFKGMHGISTGLYASYQLDAKFSLRSGLGYSLLSGFQPKFEGAMEPLTPDFFEPIESTILDEYSTVASLENNQDLPIESLQYLDLPVALSYKMSQKVGILMGMKFSYLLNAKTDSHFATDLNDDESDLLNQALYNSMRKMDVATVLGVGIYPTKKMGLELKYNHGLVDYTIDENWHVRQLNSNKTFELSLNYLFK